MTSDNSTTDGDPEEIAIRDALGRADVWRDFGWEFLRLGKLVDVMRGPAAAARSAVQAAQACQSQMLAEVSVAERWISLMRAEISSKVSSDE